MDKLMHMMYALTVRRMLTGNAQQYALAVKHYRRMARLYGYNVGR